MFMKLALIEAIALATATGLSSPHKFKYMYRPVGFEYRNRSRHTRHQGRQEIARRKAQIARGVLKVN